ncbi:hypothetical protein L1887_13496 [Cichorium endivia]|nr:hypothetical protein L1887_13496 [Cichorium endivia]
MKRGLKVNVESQGDDIHLCGWTSSEVSKIQNTMKQALVTTRYPLSDVFRWLAGNSSHNLDIMAQYWQLIARPGLMVLVLEIMDTQKKHSGVYPDYTEEPSEVAPNVKNVTLLIKDWFDSGVLHAKVWEMFILDLLTSYSERYGINNGRSVDFIPLKQRCRSPLPPYVEVPHRMAMLFQAEPFDPIKICIGC